MSDDLKRLRKLLKMTQKEFAELVGCSKPTIERWETSKDKITGPIVLLTQMLEDNPKYVDKISIPDRKSPLRLWYMHEKKVCTLIDVDEIKKEVKIKNYVDGVMFRAFGKNDNPSFDDYEKFLESRCFPKERDKLKLVLRDLDIPFYDPLMIIEKTSGRMAEDNFWLRIER